MTAQEQSKDGKRTVCIPIDASQNASHVVDWAMENILNKDNDKVVLINVRECPKDVFGVECDYKYFEDRKEESLALLDRTSKRMTSNGFECKSIALRGEPRTELECEIGRLNPDLILVGSRGLGMVGRALMGSVSTHLIHHCKNPIVVVPPLIKQ
ncbi:hypothetical protein BC833DRAFT_575614 [Globomyces pollinis-pini]|nr:hypothetical protein BC833DRAFT_575614 [Globomyces pollinis-pini]KAJ3000023.1 hypothetical protein HDV02_000975 [Globomyces sp. JEL0801]